MSVVVSGLGMVSSVGRDVVSACAAVRAGLSRPAAVPHYSVFDDDTGEAAPLVGFPMLGFSDGFYQLGLWVRLGHACVGDLLRYGRLPAGSERPFWSRTGLVVVTPQIDEERFGDADTLTPNRIALEYGHRVLSLLGLPVPASQVFLVSIGHAGAARAVQGAMELIEGRHLDRVIVLAVDSYLDMPTLDWLAAHDRLKTPEDPAALVPGEAGACFLLESATVARARGARVEALVVGGAVGEEPNTFFSDRVSAGVELSNAIGQLVPEGSVFAGDLLADLNGEPWRAYELASARVRLSGRLADTVRLVLPASSLGETGAASGAVGVCVATRAFVRGATPASDALVASSSEHGHVGAIRLTKVPAAESQAAPADR